MESLIRWGTLLFVLHFYWFLSKCGFFFQICDWPLATLDSRTMEPEYFTVAKSSINVLVGTYYNYGAGVAYSPKQKWYWHPYQNPDEVLIFHHFSKNRWLLNPHTSFLNRNCPKDTQTRKSVEFRVALFFWIKNYMLAKEWLSYIEKRDHLITFPIKLLLKLDWKGLC